MRSWRTLPSPGAATLLALAAWGAGGCNGQFRFDDVLDGGPGAVEAGIDRAAPPPPSPACKVDSDCKLPTLHCDVLSGTCVPCLLDTQCPSSTPRCDAALHRCVECGVPGDCASGETCDVVARRCVTSCNNLAGCLNVTAPLCDLMRGFCIRCLQDLECFQDPDRVCDTSDGQCVQCLTDAQCSGSTPRCDVYEGTCVACLSGADCPAATPFCDPSTGTCASG